MTAIAIPYMPASLYAVTVPTAITITGSAVACMPTARPAMMLVAWPVVDCWEMRLTGPKRVPV